MELYLGIDGGGSKTALAAGGRQGPVVARRRVGGSSLARRSAQAVHDELEPAIAALVRAADGDSAQCRAVYAGFASAGNPANRRTYTGLLQAALPRALVTVTTDMELTWQACSGGADAILVIAGTGSVVYGRYQGREARVGGSGPGRDPGSGDWIGRSAVAAGLAPAPGTGDYAGLVPTLARDPAAHALLQQAGEALARQLRQCARALGWSAPQVFAAGSVLEHIPAVAQALEQSARVTLHRPAMPAEEAALALARKMAVPETVGA